MKLKIKVNLHFQDLTSHPDHWVWTKGWLRLIAFSPVGLHVDAAQNLASVA